MEEEKKKRMEQKILQIDDKVRRPTKLWTTQYSDVISVSYETKRVQTGHWHDPCKQRVAADGD